MWPKSRSCYDGAACKKVSPRDHKEERVPFVCWTNCNVEDLLFVALFVTCLVIPMVR